MSQDLRNVYETLDIIRQNNNEDISQKDLLDLVTKDNNIDRVQCSENNMNMSEINVYDILEIENPDPNESEINDNPLPNIDVYDALNVEEDESNSNGYTQYKYTISLYEMPTKSMTCFKWDGPFFCMLNISGIIYIDKPSITELSIPLPCDNVKDSVQTVVYNYKYDNETNNNISFGYCKIKKKDNIPTLSIYSSTESSYFETFTTYQFNINIFV